MTAILRVTNEEEKRSLLFLGAQRKKKTRAKSNFSKQLTSIITGTKKGVKGRDNLLFSETADFPFEVFILKFRVVVTADVGVIEGVVV